MYRGVNVLNLLPDRPGRGGTKLGYHAFQQEPINDTRQTMNVHVWQDSWRSDMAGISGGAYLNENQFEDTNVRGANVRSMALHGYHKYSDYNPAGGPITEILGHNVWEPGSADAEGYVWNYSSYVGATTYITGGTAQIVWNINELCGASPTYPAVFLGIGNRTFIATGINECQIYDSSRGNDVFGNGSGAPRIYDLGTDAPTAVPTIGALTPGVPGGVGSQTTGWVHIGSKYITQSVPNGDLSVALPAVPADTHVFRADGVTWDIPPGPGTNTIDIQDGTSTFSTVGMTVSIPNGSNVATFGGAAIPSDHGWIMLTLTVNGMSFIMEAFGNAGPAETPVLGPLECRLDHAWEGRKLPREPFDPETPPDPLAPIWDPNDDIDGQPFTVTGYRWSMTRGGAGSFITWPGGDSMKNTVTCSITTTGGNMIWSDTPPTYAYAWYDPATGHISNISPLFSPTPTLVDQTNVGISFSTAIGSISYPPMLSERLNELVVDGVPSEFPTSVGRWTNILFFRTLMDGGSTLYPIGSLQPWVTDAVDPTIVRPNPKWMGLPNWDQALYHFPPEPGDDPPFWTDPSNDSDLLVSGALRAPQFTNGKPKYTNNGETVTLFPAHMAYWDGRLWTACTQDPAAIHYSCDRVQCPFGVPEESFPDTNVLRIPASDGAIRGMKLIGENLLITTERWAYTVAGNNESNYRLIRISTRMAGVGDYQMDEFVPNVEGQTALVVFLGTDSKVYAMPLGGEATWISKDIQTLLERGNLSWRNNYSNTRVHTISVGGRRIVLVHFPVPLSVYPYTEYHTFQYDFDQKVWTEHTLKNTNTTTSGGKWVSWMSLPTQLESNVEVYSIPYTTLTTTERVELRRWFGPSLTTVETAIPSGYVRTFPLNFDGLKTRKRLHFIRIYVNDVWPAPTGWNATVRRDSGAGIFNAAFVQEYDAAYRQIPDGSYPVDASTDAEMIVTDAMLTPDTPLVGYTFDVQITFPENTAKLYRLYRVQIGWSTLSEEQVDP